MLSPLTREDSCSSRFTTCAPRRLAASSKLTRVRVEGSMKRLATVDPASTWLIAGRAPSGRTRPCERSSSCSSFRRRQALEGEQVAQGAIGAQLLGHRFIECLRSCVAFAVRTSAAGSPRRRRCRCPRAARGVRRAPLARCCLRASLASSEEKRSSTRCTGSAKRRCSSAAKAARRRRDRRLRAVDIIRGPDDQARRPQARAPRARWPPSQVRWPRTRPPGAARPSASASRRRRCRCV